MTLIDKSVSLRRLFPPETICVICGPVTSAAAPPPVEGFQTAILVTPEPVENAPSANGQTRHLWALLSDKAGEATFYRTNNPALSGLTAPDALRPFWQNLTAVEETQRTTTTLDRLLAENRTVLNGAAAPNWLVIDRLGSARILDGARAALEAIDVVIIKCLVEPSEDPSLTDSSIDEVSQRLEAAGFVEWARTRERHPAFAQATFVRDYARALSHTQARFDATVSSLRDELGAARSEAEARQHTIDRVCDEREQLADKAASLEAQVAALTDDKSGLAEALAAVTGERDELAQSVEALSQEKAQLQASLDEATQSRTELNAQLEALTSAKSALEQSLDAAHREKAELATGADQLRTEIGEKTARIADLKRQLEAMQTLSKGLSNEIAELRHLQLARMSAPAQAPIEALRARADARFDAGDFKIATEYYRAILDMAPDDAWAVQGLAESLARLPYRADPHWYCRSEAEAIAEDGKWDVVVRLYRKALKLDPQIASAFHEAHPPHPVKPGEGFIDDPVFVVGCGHSGTSVMIRALGHHPDLYPIPKESAIFLRDDGEAQKAMAGWDKACADAQVPRWIEKTPPHIFQIPRFLAFRPKAKFILMLRDGRDVVCSLRHRQGYSGIGDRIERWVYDNLAGRPYWDHPQVRVVKYEDFVAEPDSCLREICSFLDIDFNPSMKEYHKSKVNWYSDRLRKPDEIEAHEDHKDLRNWQINQPIFDGRGKWETDMPAAERKAFKASEAQTLLEELGYADGGDW